MTDKELLELAAKAAGFETAEWQDLAGWGEVRYGLSEAIWNGEQYWNPLADDGDALRLAVEIGMRVETPKYKGFGSTAQALQDGSVGCTVFLEDPFAQTRRAIVRAAAAIGEAMP